MKNKILPIILIICFSLLFSSCSSILSRNFVYSQKHAIPASSSNAGYTSITSYEELVKAIQDMISHCRKEQSFHLSDYSENIDNEIKRAIQQIYSEPLGAYAVSNILYKTSLILNYYDLSLSISYKCQPSDIENIIPLSGKMDLKLVLAEKLSSFNTKVIFSSEHYENITSDIDDCLFDVYFSNPLYAIGLTGYNYTVYPNENTFPCIVELDIEYIEPRFVLMEKARETELELENIRALADECDTQLKTVKFFHDYLAVNTQYDESSESFINSSNNHNSVTFFTIYSAVMEGKAVSTGYALAMKALCNMQGITCQLVSGYHNSTYHMWNRIYVNGKWYNIDVSSDSLGNGEVGYAYFCVTDDEMLRRFEWNESSKKYCRTEMSADTLLAIGIDEHMRSQSRYKE